MISQSSSSSSSSSSPIPMATLTTIAICTAIYFYQITFSPNFVLHQYTMNPRSILYLHEYYRCITSPLFHTSTVHIAMNLMSLTAIGSSLERRFGTLWIGCTILWSILLTSFMYVSVAFLVYVVLGTQGLMYSHSVGFSGVLFHLMVVQSYAYASSSTHATTTTTTTAVFGLFRVPSTVYPWVLMVVLQIVIPHLSLMGHLSGVLCGTCQVYGLLNPVCLPRMEYLRSCDERVRSVLLTIPPSIPHPFVRSRYVDTSSVVQPPQQDFGVLLRMVSSVCGNVCSRAIRGCCWEKVYVGIFGHPDARDNDNIRFSGSGEGVMNALRILMGNGESSDDNDGQGCSSSNATSDDNSWIGLPPIPKISPPPAPESALV